MNCPNCNFTLEDGASFCPQCGTPIQNLNTENPTATQAPPPNTIPQQQPFYTNSAQQASGIPQPQYRQPNPGFCRNCGNPLSPGAAVCIHCGVAVGVGNRFCRNCGAPCDPMASVCTRCGTFLGNNPGANIQAKSKVCAGLLGIFLGSFGAHNFYLGFTSKAIIQLVCTIVGMILSCLVVGVFVVMGIGIWGFVEGIMILTGSIPADARGIPLRD